MALQHPDFVKLKRAEEAALKIGDVLEKVGIGSEKARILDEDFYYEVGDSLFWSFGFYDKKEARALFELQFDHDPSDTDRDDSLFVSWQEGLGWKAGIMDDRSKGSIGHEALGFHQHLKTEHQLDIPIGNEFEVSWVKAEAIIKAAGIYFKEHRHG